MEGGIEGGINVDINSFDNDDDDDGDDAFITVGSGDGYDVIYGNIILQNFLSIPFYRSML